MRTAHQRWHRLVIDMHLPKGLFSTRPRRSPIAPRDRDQLWARVGSGAVLLAISGIGRKFNPMWTFGRPRG
jgi:hypothetical protein